MRRWNVPLSVTTAESVNHPTATANENYAVFADDEWAAANEALRVVMGLVVEDGLLVVAVHIGEPIEVADDAG